MAEEKEEESLHTEMQYQLLKIGTALGYNVIPASNDHSKCFAGNNFSFMSLTSFPEFALDKETLNTELNSLMCYGLKREQITL